MELDHILLACSNVATMEQFFTQTLGLTPGKRPAFPFEGCWLYGDGPHALIHLVDKRAPEKQRHYLLNQSSATVQRHHSQKGIVDHIALRCRHYLQVKQRLIVQQTHYFERQVPESQQQQIFVLGPEHLKIELLFPPLTSNFNHNLENNHDL